MYPAAMTVAVRQAVAARTDGSRNADGMNLLPAKYESVCREESRIAGDHAACSSMPISEKAAAAARRCGSTRVSEDGWPELPLDH
jgi:hypothetical protein